MEQQLEVVSQHHVKHALLDTIVQEEQIKQRVRQENIDLQQEEKIQMIVQRAHLVTHLLLEHQAAMIILHQLQMLGLVQL